MPKTTKTRHRIRLGAVRVTATGWVGQTVYCSCEDYVGDEVVRRTKPLAVNAAQLVFNTHAAMARSGRSAVELAMGRVTRSR